MTHDDPPPPSRSPVAGWLAFAWAVCFAYLGLAPRLDLPASRIDRVDLIGHLLASALLAALLSEWLTGRPSLRRSTLAGAALAAALGVVIEAIQLLVPQRSAEIADLVADLVGAGAGAWAYGIVRARLGDVVILVRAVAVVAIAAAVVLALRSV